MDDKEFVERIIAAAILPRISNFFKVIVNFTKQVRSHSVSSPCRSSKTQASQQGLDFDSQHARIEPFGRRAIALPDKPTI